jgi:glutamate formiminotransferase/formiminotetrahydrofolate cyclodeaminase
VQEATKNAILVPFKVMETAYSGFEPIKAMVEIGNPNSITDAGVGALAIRACIRGAFLNVKINASGLLDKEFVKTIITKGEKIEASAEKAEKEILELVNKSINKE